MVKERCIAKLRDPAQQGAKMTGANMRIKAITAISKGAIN
jgi:hypothetical protein